MPRHLGNGTWLLLAPALLWLLLFMAAPLAQLVVASFQQTASGGLAIGGFTLAHYLDFLGRAFYLQVLLNTFLWAGGVAIGCLVLGYPLALIMRGAAPGTRNLLTLVLLAPLLISLVVRNYGWLILLGPNGPVARLMEAAGITPPQMSFTPFAVMLALVHTSLAYTVMAVLGSLERIDPAVLRAAEGLGASGARIFFRITLPLSLPGILAGSSIVFSLAASSFVTPEILGGARVKFAGSFVYEQVVSLLNFPAGSAIGLILSLGTLALLLVYSGLMQGGRRAAAFK